MSERIRAGITLGDVNGIGPEVVIKTLMDDRIYKFMTVNVYGSSRALSYHRNLMKADHFKFNIAKPDAKPNTKTANIINCWPEKIDIRIGEATEEAGKLAMQSIDAALKDMEAGEIDFVVTAPLNKSTVPSVDRAFTGQTEYIAKYFSAKDNLMMLLNDSLKVALVTQHVPIRSVADKLSTDIIANKIKLLHKSLRRDFLIDKPKIAVLGLNPHASDNGLIGDEEQNMIIPAVSRSKKDGIIAMGPFPADGFFGAGNYLKFDAILAMYHDQGLIPFKALSFSSGVNFTAGIQHVRTSPDHGTAYDIAGKNVANPDSFRQALFTGLDIYRNRREFDRMQSNKVEKTQLASE